MAKPKKMNEHERAAWKRLLALGVRPTFIGSLIALDLGSRRILKKDMPAFVDAVINVAGRSGVNRRHVNRRGEVVLVVTDDLEPGVAP